MDADELRGPLRACAQSLIGKVELFEPNTACWVGDDRFSPRGGLLLDVPKTASTTKSQPASNAKSSVADPREDSVGFIL